MLSHAPYLWFFSTGVLSACWEALDKTFPHLLLRPDLAVSICVLIADSLYLCDDCFVLLQPVESWCLERVEKFSNSGSCNLGFCFEFSWFQSFESWVAVWLVAYLLIDNSNRDSRYFWWIWNVYMALPFINSCKLVTEQPSLVWKISEKCIWQLMQSR